MLEACLGMSQNSMARTLFEKVWDAHQIIPKSTGPSLIYIDRHLIHEVTSPQAFDGLRLASRRVRRPDLTVATVDHNIPTGRRGLPILDQTSSVQINTLESNCKEFGIKLYGMDSPQQGIVHVIGPQLGITLPGSTIVCGDSHTSTHGAFGAFALGIGTSEVEHVLATQTLWVVKPRTYKIVMSGQRRRGVTSKDLILYMIRHLGTGGGAGSVFEYMGDAIRGMNMEQRMTICNMSIEGGARAGMIAPDDTTYDYLRNRLHTPPNFEHMVDRWKETLYTDNDAKFDRSFTINTDSVSPQISWGTNPGMTCDITDTVPDPINYSGGDINLERGARRALQYMNLEPGTPMTDIKVDRVFIGSCTNARLHDLVEASDIIQGGRVAEGVRAMVVPGSQMVKAQAEEMGIHDIFINAGFEWRNSGCSMCLGMNPDILEPGQRCASTSNRNFEGRQGSGGRTHLVSPAMAAAAAIHGKFVDIRELIQ